MTSTQKCPICGIEHIPAEKNQCPQCDADLSCFKMLEKIPDETAVVPAKPSNARMLLLYLLVSAVILCLGLAAFQLYRFRQLENMLAEQKAYLAKSIAGQDRKSDKKPEKLKAAESPSPVSAPGPAINNEQEAGDKQQVSELHPTVSCGPETTDTVKRIFNPLESDLKNRFTLGVVPEADFRFYEAKEEDTLWDIAEECYGAGHYYPVLLEHNPQIGIYGIGEGVRVKILKNTGQARAIYRRIIIKEGEHIFWNYTVTEGDTFQSVMMKFYKPEEINQIPGITPDEPLHPGKKIKILLK